jgi:aminomethyltransferase
MKRTALYEVHKKLGAKIVPFAGYEMPLKYSGDIDEHVTVRTKLGVFDVSHMGEFWVEGDKALDLLQWVTTNDVSKLYDGKAQYSCLPNGKGGIVDDLLVYRFNEKKYLLVVNAANIEKDWNWISEQNNKFGAKLRNASDEISQLAVQGPLAIKAMKKLTSHPIEDMKFYTFDNIEFAGVENVIFSITGYTGAGGCEIYFPNKYAEKIWNAVMEAGEEYGIKPAGLAARDTLRLEMGYCLYGNDIDDTTSPIEAGLGWIVKFNKDFIDKDLLLKQKEEGVSRKLVGFVMEERGIPRHGYEIVDASGNVIGNVTSGTMSPMMKVGIGMGYVKTEFSKPDSEIFIRIRNKDLKAKVVKLPIYKG